MPNPYLPPGTTGEMIDEAFGDAALYDMHGDCMELNQEGDYYCPRCRALDPQ